MNILTFAAQAHPIFAIEILLIVDDRPVPEILGDGHSGITPADWPLRSGMPTRRLSAGRVWVTGARSGMIDRGGSTARLISTASLIVFDQFRINDARPEPSGLRWEFDRLAFARAMIAINGAVRE